MGVTRVVINTIAAPAAKIPAPEIHSAIFIVSLLDTLLYVGKLVPLQFGELSARRVQNHIS